MCVSTGSHLQVSAGYLKFEAVSFEENVASAKGGAISVILGVFVLAIFIYFPFIPLVYTGSCVWLLSRMCRCAKKVLFFFYIFWLMHKSMPFKVLFRLGP